MGHESMEGWGIVAVGQIIEFPLVTATFLLFPTRRQFSNKKSLIFGDFLIILSV